MDRAIHFEHYHLRHREADRHGDLRLAGWFDFLQEAAANHAAILGVGLDTLRRENMIWVLSKLRLEIGRSPRIGEAVTVETYPNGFRRIYAARQFRITGGDGAEIARASSSWLLLALPGMRPVKLEKLPVTLPDNSDRPDYFELSEKLPPRELEPLFEVPIRYSMEDVNGHLNNAEYAGMVQDFAARLLGDSPKFRTVELHFLSAVREGDRLALAGELRDGRLFVQGTGRTGAVSFTASAEIYS